MTSSVEFLGACLDTGAERTVIGKEQVLAYLALVGKIFKLEPPKAPIAYRLGRTLHPTVGALVVRIPVAGTNVLSLDLSAVDVSLPLLIGLDSMDEHTIYVNKVTHEMVCVSEGVSARTVRKLGHVFCVWGADVLYTFSELRRIRRHFFNAQPQRLHAIMRHAADHRAEPGTL